MTSETQQQGDVAALTALGEWLMTPWRSHVPHHRGTLRTTNKSIKYFRGGRAVKALTSPEYAAARVAHPSLLDLTLDYINTYGKRLRTGPNAPVMPTVDNETDAKALLTKMLRMKWFVRCDRFGAKKEREIELIQPQRTDVIEEEQYYAWLMPDPPRWATLIAIGIVVAVFLCMLFPLWPQPLRLAVSWILTVAAGVLIAFLAFVFTLRPLIWLVTSFIVPPGLWILPNANEDVGFFDSFKPIFSFGTWEYPDPTRMPPAKKGVTDQTVATEAIVPDDKKSS